MPQTKKASTRKRRKEIVPALGVVGVSLSLASGASGAAAAAAVGQVSDIPFNETAPGPRINLSEEEISDVSLGTFYVFDKETPKLGEQYAQRGGRGCGGCRGGRGCGRVAVEAAEAEDVAAAEVAAAAFRGAAAPSARRQPRRSGPLF